MLLAATGAMGFPWCKPAVQRAGELKLKGRPWKSNIKGDDESRRLLLSVISKVYELGWTSHVSVNFTLRLSLDNG